MPLMLDAVTNDAVCAVVMNTDAETQDALVAVTGINDIAAAIDVLIA